jgi:hypothetical protein
MAADDARDGDMADERNEVCDFRSRPEQKMNF